MTGFNRVILAGNLTRDPETKYTQSGTAIVSFGLAVNRTWKDGNGEKKEECTFVDITAFGKSGETIAQYLKKGRPLLVEGRLKLDQWEDKQTQQKRSKLGVVLESFTFLDSGNNGGGQRQEPAKGPDRNTADVPAGPVEDDVPFRSPLPSAQRQALGIPSFNKLA